MALGHMSTTSEPITVSEDETQLIGSVDHTWLLEPEEVLLPQNKSDSQIEIRNMRKQEGKDARKAINICSLWSLLAFPIP